MLETFCERESTYLIGERQRKEGGMDGGRRVVIVFKNSYLDKNNIYVKYILLHDNKH